MHIIDTWLEDKKKRLKKFLPYIIPLILLWGALFTICTVMKFDQDIITSLHGCFILIFLVGLLNILVQTDNNDNLFWFILFACFTIYSANWFFDDYKKTLAFPLAYIFYSIAKSMLPTEILKHIQKMESFLIFRNPRQDKPLNKHKHNSQAHKLRKGIKQFPIVFRHKKAGKSKHTPKNKKSAFTCQ